MYKVRKIRFINYPVLKNMELDFTGRNVTISKEYKCHSYKHSGHKEIARALVVYHPA